MRAHYCWRHVHSVAEWLHFLEGDNRPFALPGTSEVHAPDRPVVPKHLHLEIKVCPTRETVTGQMTMLLTSRRDDVSWIRFDATDLEIEAIYIQGTAEPASFNYDGRHLNVHLAEPLAYGSDTTIVVAYRVEKPALGLYFIKPTPAEPERPVHVWSQNQDDDARYWFPCIDSPGVKMTTSMAVTVPDSLMALSNGTLEGNAPQPHADEGWHTWRWQHDVPHPVYLMSLVVGAFSEHREPNEAIDLVWYSLPGREEDAQRAFEKTDKMIRFFSDFTGVPYPYSRYAQVAVSEFVFGGMENTTFTTVTERVLPDERAAIDYSADSLIAHELAHQWFGDLVTCREWSHAWLNEGFATYFDCLFKQHDMGQDEFDYELYELAADYFVEDGTRYRRPIVCREYAEPIDMFDRHLYHKGAWVLHMLRHTLGNDAFKRGIRVYLERFGVNQAETSDLRRALEDSTGHSLTAFFDQWLHKAGYPALKMQADHDLNRGVLTLSVSYPESEEWSLATEVLVRSGDDEQRIPITISKATQSVVIGNVGTAVDAVVLDPDAVLLCTIKQTLPTQWLIGALVHAPSVTRRIDAAKALAGCSGKPARDALINALVSDGFWGVRKQVANVLGAAGGPVARDALMAALDTEVHPKARRGIVNALGGFVGDAKVTKRLCHILSSGDESYFVESEAARSIGRLRDEMAIDALRDALAKDSFNDVIRTSALDGLAQMRQPDTQRDLEQGLDNTNSTLVRVAAIVGLGRISAELPETRQRVLSVLEPFKSEHHFRIQIALISALATMNHSDAIPLLNHISAHGRDGRVKRRAQEAVRGIQKGMDGSARLTQLSDTLDQLKASHGKLRDRIDRIED